MLILQKTTLLAIRRRRRLASRIARSLAVVATGSLLLAGAAYWLSTFSADIAIAACAAVLVAAYPIAVTAAGYAHRPGRFRTPRPQQATSRRLPAITVLAVEESAATASKELLARHAKSTYDIKTGEA